MKDLFLRLYNAENYEELHNIVHSNVILSNPDSWEPYGGNRNNCGTFENQQAAPESALVEKITNSIDAILVKECMLKGIDPHSGDPDVPKTMNAAIEDFFNIKDGSWDNASSTERREIAKRLQLIVSGDRQTPNVAIYDDGEGQIPAAFKDTFLSLYKGNKMSIPFVQGKFNMGATGAAIFCGGKERYQLIVSRRYKDICEPEDYLFGFTLIRKHPLTDEENEKLRATWYEYFTINGDVPSFRADSIQLDLQGGEPFIDGTIVKLFSYELSRGCTSNATLDLWRELNTLLYEASLPVLICELRDFKGHSNEKVLLGNRTRLSIDDRDKKYKSLSFSINDPQSFGAEIPIEVTIFNRDVKNPEFIKKRSLVLIINGQTQGWESTTFVSQDLGFRQLRDFMLISVDCTKIKSDVRNDIFMSSRDRMRQCKNYNNLKDQIIALLKNNYHLKQLNQEYKGKFLHESQDDKNLIQEVFAKFKRNKNIRRLLTNTKGLYSFSTTRITKPEGKVEKRDGGKEEAVKLQRFPSVFRVKNLKEKDGKMYKAIPLGGKGSILFETDAENEYLSRTVDKGELEIKILGYSNEGGGKHPHPPLIPTSSLNIRRTGPYDGEIRITFEPNEQAAVGDVFEISAKLLSLSGDMECIVYVGIEEEHKQRKKSDKPKEEPDLNLPRLVRVFKEKTGNNVTTWADCTPIMIDSDVLQLKINDKQGIDDILINMDSNLLKKQISGQTAISDIGNKYVTSVYSHALILYSTFVNYYTDNDASEVDEYIRSSVKDDLQNAIENIFKYYGQFLMEYTNIDVSED